MHWTYKIAGNPNLEQGDLLEPTEYLTEQVLSKYHPYYSKHPDNKLYIVLTQSCDLVPRKGQIKADYITLAPVRPLSAVIKRKFSQQLQNAEHPDAQPFGSNRVKNQFEDFLRKLFNNNLPPYFYIRKQEDKHIPQDMCAITSLSISIKPEHCPECIKARVLQLDDLFQAKLGWLVGQKYSRVGTRDWPKEELDKEVDQILSSGTVWIDEEKMTRVKKVVSERSKTQVVDRAQIQEILDEIPPKKTQAIDAVIKILASQGLLPEASDPKIVALRKTLRSDPDFSQFF